MRDIPITIWLYFLFSLALPTQAADTGPLVFKIDTSNIVGETRESSKKPIVTIQPDTGGRCAMEVRHIDEHRAPNGYLGWHVVFTFSHPKIDEEFATRTMDFFWNGEIFTSPFSAGFESTYKYLDPFADFPNAYSMKFDEESKKLTFGGTASSGLVIPEFIVKLNSEKTEVETLTYQLTVLGNLNTDITCTQTAKIENIR